MYLQHCFTAVLVHYVATTCANRLQRTSKAELSPPTQTSTLSIDTSQTYQIIDGFGFCEAFQRANAIYNASKEVQNQVLNLLFNTTTGAGLSILRIGLGSSPDTTRDHMNSIEPAPPDSGRPDAPPNYTWDHSGSNQVWMAKQALRRGVNIFYADAWSAPGYMKTNGRDDQGGYLCGVQGTDCTTGNWIHAYVDYLVQYVKSYLDEGIPLRYVGFLNEPNLVKNYSTMLSDGRQAVEVLRPLRAALSVANLSSPVGVSCCEGQGWSMQRDLLPALKGVIASKELSLISTHAYKGNPPAPDRPFFNSTNGTDTNPPVWITENSPIMKRLGFTRTWYRTGAENEGLTWANNLQTALAVGNVNAYLYWIGAGPWGSEVPLIWIPQRKKMNSIRLPSNAPSFQLAGTYWATAHWSRFIRPEAIRVSANFNSSSTNSTLLASAYRNKDGSVVVQVINNDDSDQPLNLSLPPAAARQSITIRSWLTDNNHNMTEAGVDSPSAGKQARVMINARSLTTFLATYRWKDSR